MPEITNVLIIGKVWPEPKSSAAGSRMMQLITLFQEKGWKVTFATAARESEFAFDLSTVDVTAASISINDASFDEFVYTLNPQVVLFDRFMTEEQFGWRVAEQCPNALRLLDTEDLHCYREATRLALKVNRVFQQSDLMNEIAKREIASILRCDCSLIISEVEMELLTNYFKIDADLLCYIPFMVESKEIRSSIPYEKREHFISIGNFLHEPNWDAVVHLKKMIWPSIRSRLPKAELHIYGAYPSQKVTDLHNQKDGFLIKGRAEDALDVVSKARVLLAPLRFGAGLKGKLFDALLVGTPSVTTSIGAEGMNADLDWSGIIENELEGFINASVLLYEDELRWNEVESKRHTILRERFSTSFGKEFVNKIEYLIENLSDHRQKNFLGAMLQHHSMASTRFMSKWIEEKNK